MPNVVQLLQRATIRKRQVYTTGTAQKYVYYSCLIPHSPVHGLTVDPGQDQGLHVQS